MALVGYSPFANLENAEVSQKKSNWSKNDKGLDSVAGAQLQGASLRYALAAGAFLVGANLSHAHLGGAYLRVANLSVADLSGANLSRADLSGADLSDADLRGADLSDADIPIIENIDSKILAAIEDGGTLNMGAWHSCETSHCRAGWAITIAGEAGLALEKSVGAAAAGALIYAKSAPTLPVPNFYTTDALALADIKKRAAAEIVAADSAQS